MQTQLIERGWTDLRAAPKAVFTVTHLTDTAEPRWVGLIDLGPSGTYALDAGRHDLYVLQGNVDLGGCSLNTDDFLMCGGATLVSAGERGARLLMYRDASGSECEPAIACAKDRAWLDGRIPRMRVALLSNCGHRVTLVAWQPGAHTVDHTHPNGEEIFVLSGELRSGAERYPAGTWLRLHPGARHAPFADGPTTILLRHGHLPAKQA